MLLLRDDGHEIDTDPDRLDRAQVHQWISTDSYWARGRAESVMATAIANSTCYGVYEPTGRQVGFARSITDGATFAWVCDVYIHREARGRGLGTWLAQSIVTELQQRGLPRIVLATADAHEVYRKAGLSELAHPERWMEVDTRVVLPPNS